MPGPEEIEGAAPSIVGHIDSPAEDSVFSAWVHVSGWTFAEGGEAVRLQACVDGRAIAEIPVGLPRPDVRAAFPSFEGAELSGFDIWLPKRSLPDEAEFLLTLEASTSKTRCSLGTRALTWVPQPGLPLVRGDYRQVWDEVSQTYEQARVSVCATSNLEEYERSGADTAATIAGATQLGPSDTVLEIGCGTGRIGLHLAPLCGRWMGADVSRNMLEHALQAMNHLPNVSLHVLKGSDLQGFDDNSVDIAYSSGVFMHLDEWDRYRYVTEMFRVLRPGGRVFYDNLNLLSDEGWNVFLTHCRLDPLERPPNISKSSTPQELMQYARKAGFEDIKTHARLEWITVWAKKPVDGAESRA
jgi:SAM-dependent methyltransferase